jgi:ferric-dicitrate binding protein FerR (iron transport regulator)
VEVLGTSFNINAYEDEETEKTTLIDGAVKVKSAKQAAMLKPGDQAAISQAAAIPGIEITAVQTDNVIAWKSNLFLFEKTPMQEVLRQLSRWYNIKIIYKTPLAFTFNGEISRSEPFSRVLQLLRVTEKMKLDLHGNELTVSGI